MENKHILIWCVCFRKKVKCGGGGREGRGEYAIVFCWHGSLKKKEALGVAEFERGKNFGDLFLAKLKTAITFAPVIRMTIIIYAFGVEKNFPYFGSLP